MSLKNPLLTVGVISHNRLHYLRATLESAYQCIQYPNIEWIVLDDSTEPGLKEYIQSREWIQHKILTHRLSHVEKMNILLERTGGTFLLIWPDDVQFIVKGGWMADCIEILTEHPWIGSLVLNALRQQSIDRLFTWRRYGNLRQFLHIARIHGIDSIPQKLIFSTRGFGIRTFGFTRYGIVGSGIPSLTRTETWRKLGPWKTTEQEKNLADSSGGGETEMLQRYANSGLSLQRAVTLLPVAADIITDPKGTKAKIRGSTRYGVYSPPPVSSFYYAIHTREKILSKTTPAVHAGIPGSFEDLVTPMGYKLPIDKTGNLMKISINTDVTCHVE